MRLHVLFSTLLTGALLLSAAATLSAQGNKPPASPPKSATGMVGDAEITVEWAAPSVKGREIWGALVPYDQVWRTGANKATTFETSADIMVEGQKLAAGKYSLFTIPGKDEWTIVFNSVSDQWGSYNYDAAKDVLRVKVKSAVCDLAEMLGIAVEDNMLKIHWEKVCVAASLK